MTSLCFQSLQLKLYDDLTIEYKPGKDQLIADVVRKVFDRTEGKIMETDAICVSN